MSVTRRPMESLKKSNQRVKCSPNPIKKKGGGMTSCMEVSLLSTVQLNHIKNYRAHRKKRTEH